MHELVNRIPVNETLHTIIGAAAIVILTVLAAWIARGLLSAVASRITAKTRTDLDDRLLRSIRRHIYYLVYIVGLTMLFNFLEEASADWASGVFRFLDEILFVVAVGVIAHMVVSVFAAVLTWYARAIASRTETTVDDEFLPLLDRGVKIVVYVLALLIILEHFDVDIKGLVAVLGVGSLAVALAAQETIANMIGGFVIMIDRPFRRGDRVRLDDGTVCIVDQIGIRSTKFLTFDNTLIIIPNADLMKSTVHNLTYPAPQVRVRVDVGVGYDSDMARVRKVMLDEAARHPKVLDDPEPAVFFLEFGDSALNVSLRCRVGDVSEQFLTASELREQVLNRFRKEGIEIPFPQRVVTMVGEQIGAGTSPVEPAAVASAGKPKGTADARSREEGDSGGDDSSA